MRRPSAVAAELRWQLALSADAARLVPLCIEHAAYERLTAWPDDAGFGARLAALLAARALHAWLLLDEADQAQGYASLTLDNATLGAYRFAHLDCLYLRPAARGRGQGAALMAQLKHFARQQGCQELQWQTPPWNEGAIGFYQSQGASMRAKQRFCLPLQP